MYVQRSIKNLTRTLKNKKLIIIKVVDSNGGLGSKISIFLKNCFCLRHVIRQDL